MNRFHREKNDGLGPTGDDKAPVVTGVNTNESDSSHQRTEHELEEFAEAHAWDPNMDHKKLHAIENAVYTHDVEAEQVLERDVVEDSPYPEVVASVQNWDDPSLPANTIRSWCIGLMFVTVGSGMNMLFSLRQPTISVGMLVTQISSYPFGWAFAKFLPRHQFNTFGLKWSLNPGPFNKKEHALIVCMANVAFAGGAAYSTFALEAMRGFYHVNFGVWFSILLTLCTQMTGIALAGLFRRFLVFPSSSLYPSVLPNCVLFNTLHDEVNTSDPAVTNGWSISRFRYFGYVLLGAFIWYWFPGFLFQGLSVIAWVTWYDRSLDMKCFPH